MQIYHRFDGIETATRELGRLEFLLDDSLFHGKVYHVIPKSLPHNYPRRNNGRTPRFVAVVLSTGTLTFDRPFDDNPILIGYQEQLKQRFPFTDSFIESDEADCI